MHPVIARAFEHVNAARRFRWLAAIVAWLICLAGWAVVITMPDVYQARARIYVDTDSLLKPLLTGLAVNTDVMSEVNMMATVVLSRPNLERVARQTDVFLRASGAEAQERLVTGLRSRISLSAATRDKTYSVSFTDRDRATALKVVQSLVNTFVEDTLDIKRSDSSVARDFLLRQIREYEQRLTDAEERLADFKRRNVGVMPGESGDYYTRLQAALAGLETLRAKSRQVTVRRAELARQLEGEEPTFGLVPQSTDANSARIAELRSKREALLLRYTEKHPEVIALDETIVQLEQQQRAGTAAAPLGAGDVQLHALDINPVYQSMKIALSQTDAELAELRGQISEYERQIAGLRARVDTVPEIEAELSRLNRDYTVNKAQHSELLQRLETARISSEVESSGDRVKFRIIEPPAVPLAPAGPNRPLLLTMVLLASIAAAAGLALVLGQLRPVISSRDALRELSGLPVLASISAIDESARLPWHRRPSLHFAACWTALIGAYGLALMLALVQPAILRG